MEYHKVGKKNTLKSRGDYVEDIKKGIWEFYDHKSELIQKYDFDNSKLVYFKPDDKKYECGHCVDSPSAAVCPCTWTSACLSPDIPSIT